MPFCACPFAKWKRIRVPSFEYISNIGIFQQNMHKSFIETYLHSKIISLELILKYCVGMVRNFNTNSPLPRCNDSRWSTWEMQLGKLLSFYLKSERTKVQFQMNSPAKILVLSPSSYLITITFAVVWQFFTRRYIEAAMAACIITITKYLKKRRYIIYQKHFYSLCAVWILRIVFVLSV